MVSLGQILLFPKFAHAVSGSFDIAAQRLGVSHTLCLDEFAFINPLCNFLPPGIDARVDALPKKLFELRELVLERAGWQPELSV